LKNRINIFLVDERGWQNPKTREVTIQNSLNAGTAANPSLNAGSAANPSLNAGSAATKRNGQMAAKIQANDPGLLGVGGSSAIRVNPEITLTGTTSKSHSLLVSNLTGEQPGVAAKRARDREEVAAFKSEKAYTDANAKAIANKIAGNVSKDRRRRCT
jgi:hypothetical protein